MKNIRIVSLAAIAIAGLAASGAMAQAAADENEMATIIVTGTRTTGLKAADSPTPIQVLGADALKHVGQPNLIQALAQIVPSFTAEAFGGDTANLTLSARLRGLSPNHTLVLVNGKRRHGTANLHVLGGPYQGAASPDIDLIPAAAIERIEVLQDGAAAQYG
jgi:iron complex outermembrane receptor protein